MAADSAPSAAPSSAIGSPAPSEASAEPPADGARWQDETDPDRRLAGCLTDTFVLDRGAWVASLRDLMRRDLGDLDVADSGSLRLTLATDATYRIEAADSRTVSSGSGQGGDVVWVLAFDGTEEGTWTRSGDQVTLTTDRSLDTTNEISIDGQALPSGVAPGSTPWAETLTVDCDEAGLRATPTADPAAPPVAFERAG